MIFERYTRDNFPKKPPPRYVTISVETRSEFLSRCGYPLTNTSFISDKVIDKWTHLCIYICSILYYNIPGIRENILNRIEFSELDTVVNLRISQNICRNEEKKS